MTPRGASLIELIVVMAIIGIVATVASVSFRVPSVALRDSVATLRQRAVASRAVVTATMVVDGNVRSFAAFPDGRVLADAEVHLDPLAGRVDDAKR